HEAPLQTGRKARAAASTQAGRLDHLDDVGRRDLLGEDLAPGAVPAGLQIIVVGPWLVEVQGRVDDVVLLRCRTDRAVALRVIVVRHYFSPSSNSSTFAVSSFSW